MSKTFEYQRVGLGKIKTLYNYETQILTDKNVNFVAKQADADIVIYGFYDYDPETNQIFFIVDIYFPKIGEKKTLEKVTNPIDGTLFRAAETVAGFIIFEINRTVESYEAKTLTEASEPRNEKKKKKITKGVLKNRKMEVSRYMGGSFMYLPPSSGDASSVYLAEFQYLNEKFFTNWLSTHGSFTVGYLLFDSGNQGISDGYVLKIPMFTPFVVLTAPLALLTKKSPAVPLGAFPFIDGITFHLRKPGAKSWVALNIGGAFGLAYLSNEQQHYYPYLSLESGVQYFLNDRVLFSLNLTVLVPQFQTGVRFGALFKLK